MKRIYIKPHISHRNGKRVKVKGHYRYVVESRDKGRSGDKFKSLARKIAREYEKKGYSKKRANEIARKTAGKIFWQKYGKKSGSWILKRER